MVFLFCKNVSYLRGQRNVILRVSKKITVDRENKFILILLDCSAPAWWEVFWYHWSVWNVLWISATNNKQPKCWIADGIEADLVKTYQRGKYVIHKIWNPCLMTVVCISVLIGPQPSNLYFGHWSISSDQADLCCCSGNIMNSKIEPSARNMLELLPKCAKKNL